MQAQVSASIAQQPTAWLGFKIVNQAVVDQVSAGILPSAQSLSGQVWCSLMGDAGPMYVAGRIVAVTFTASKVKYSVAFLIDADPKQVVALYAVVENIESELVIAKLPEEGSVFDSVLTEEVAKLFPAAILDAIDPLLELELSGKLVAKTAALKDAGEDDPMAVVTISGEIIAIIRQLNDQSTEATPIAVTGTELGEFDDTPEGKKALREAARATFEGMLGQWVPCPALGGDVELRKSGMKKTLSLSGDARKLKLIPALKSLIANGKEIASRPSYDPKEQQSIVAYHTLRSVAALNGETLAVRFIIKEDGSGKFHWDHTVHPEDAIFDSAKANGPAEADPSTATNYKSESRPAEHRLAGGPTITPGQGMLDSVAGDQLVFNLFIEGEQPEVATDESQSDTDPELDPTEPQGYALVMADDALQLKWQDQLDAFFRERIVAVRNALRELGWEGRSSSDSRFYKGDSEVQPAFKYVGAGRNVVGFSMNEITDDLTKTPEQLAAEINAAAIAETELRAKANAVALAPESAEADAAPESAPAVTEAEGRSALNKIKQFMPKGQRAAIAEGMNGEEAQFFFDRMAEMAALIGKMPKTYGTDGEGNKAIVSLHYFKGGSDWYITEKDMEGNGTEQAFGYAVLNHDRQNAELGYISIAELVARNVELDLHWEKKPLAMVRNAMNEVEDAAAPVSTADPVTDMLAQAVADPFAHQAWTLPKAEIEAMPDADYQAIIAKLTDANYHTEAEIMRVARFGPTALEPEPTAGPVPAPEPQPERHDVSMQTLISISANSIAELRRIDVYRVLNSASNQREALATYIIENRPDLQQEVLNVMAEEWPDLGYSAPAAPETTIQGANAEMLTGAPLSSPEVPPVPEAGSSDVSDLPGEIVPENTQRTADMSYLQGVIALSVDMWADDLADRIEKIGEAYADDAEITKAWTDAINAYTDFMVTAMSQQ